MTYMCYTREILLYYRTLLHPSTLQFTAVVHSLDICEFSLLHNLVQVQLKPVPAGESRSVEKTGIKRQD